MMEVYEPNKIVPPHVVQAELELFTVCELALLSVAAEAVTISRGTFSSISRNLSQHHEVIIKI
jgi:hypothetical protein